MIKKQMKLCENLLIYFFQDVKQAQRKQGKGGFFFFFFWFCRSIVLPMSKINLKFEKQKDVDEKCFHYGVTLEENYEKLENIHKELCLL